MSHPTLAIAYNASNRAVSSGRSHVCAPSRVFQQHRRIVPLIVTFFVKNYDTKAAVLFCFQDEKITPFVATYRAAEIWPNLCEALAGAPLRWYARRSVGWHLLRSQPDVPVWRVWASSPPAFPILAPTRNICEVLAVETRSGGHRCHCCAARSK